MVDRTATTREAPFLQSLVCPVAGAGEQAAALEKKLLSYGTHLFGEVAFAPPGREKLAALPFLGNQDVYVKARFHKARIPQPGWTPDVTLEEGAEMGLFGKSRYGTFFVYDDVVLTGFETLLGLDITGLTRKERGLTNALIGRTADTNRVKARFPRIFGWSPLRWNVTDKLAASAAGRALIQPVPLAALFETSEKPPSAFVTRLIHALDRIEILAIYQPPPGHREQGRALLRIDRQKLEKNLAEGRFLDFDFDFLQAGSHADYRQLDFGFLASLFPAALSIRRGVSDVHLSYDPVSKTSLVRLENLGLNVGLASPDGEGTPVTLAIRGGLDLLLRPERQAEVRFHELFYSVDHLLLPLAGAVSTQGMLNGSVQFSLEQGRLTLSKADLTDGELGLRGTDGGPVRWRFEDSEASARVEGGSAEVRFDPSARPSLSVPKLLLKGTVAWKGPENQIEISSIAGTFSPPLSAEMTADLKWRSHGRDQMETPVRLLLNSFPPGTPLPMGKSDGGVHASLEASSVPFLGREGILNGVLLVWKKPKHCQLEGEGYAGLENVAGAPFPIHLISRFLASSDFKKVEWQLSPAPKQTWGEYLIEGFSKIQGTFWIKRFKDWYRNFEVTTPQPYRITRNGKKAARGVTLEGRSRWKKGLFVFRAASLFDLGAITRLNMELPWGQSGTFGDFEVRLFPRRIGESQKLGETTVKGTFQSPFLPGWLSGEAASTDVELKTVLEGRFSGPVALRYRGEVLKGPTGLIVRPEPNRSLLTAGPIRVGNDKPALTLESWLEGDVTLPWNYRRGVYRGGPEGSGFKRGELKITLPSGVQRLAGRDINLLLRGDARIVRRHLIDGRNIEISGEFNPGLAALLSGARIFEFNTSTWFGERLRFGEIPSSYPEWVRVLRARNK